MAYHCYGLPNQPTVKQKMVPALGNHRSIYRDGAFHTTKENDQKGERPHNHHRVRDLETAHYTA
jgi:hypothetical protein